MIETILYPIEIETIGDTERTMRKQLRGLPEASPLSPSVFNTYIDPLATAITLLANGNWNNRLNLYEDDVDLLTPSIREMQELLDECTEFAQRTGLTLNTAKCKILNNLDAGQEALFLAGVQLEYVSTAYYLGIKLTGSGIPNQA